MRAALGCRPLEPYATATLYTRPCRYTALSANPQAACARGRAVRDPVAGAIIVDFFLIGRDSTTDHSTTLRSMHGAQRDNHSQYQFHFYKFFPKSVSQSSQPSPEPACV